MHTTAKRNGQKFFNKYLKGKFENKKVLDIGSYDVNGSLKPVFTEGEYIGLDMMEGPNVDIVSSSHDIELPDESVDAIVSTSCFEHDEMFWVTFLEMCRVIKKDGYIYVNKPSAGHYHKHPGDCWRFYPDAGKALEKWAHRNNHTDIKLIESYIEPEGEWKDCVNVWLKQPT